MIIRNLYLLLLILILSFSSKASNDSCLKISETHWNTFSKEKNYIETYTDDDETKEKKKETSIGKRPSIDFGGFKYVFYIIIAGAIIFLVVKILQNINSSPNIDVDKGRVYTLSEVEDKMLDIDLDKILNDALLAADFRLALRINFLIIIKMLSLSGKIILTKEKTNWEYFNELNDPTIALKFKEIVEPFETIWYGEHELSESQFNRLQHAYNVFKNKLT
jgi:cell division protein FtsL